MSVICEIFNLGTYIVNIRLSFGKVFLLGALAKLGATVSTYPLLVVKVNSPLAFVILVIIPMELTVLLLIDLFVILDDCLPRWSFQIKWIQDLVLATFSALDFTTRSYRLFSHLGLYKQLI
jgi:hypothetical protein